MKACIVKSSTLHRHGRWDVGHYLGHTNECREAVHRAEGAFSQAKGRLSAARKRLEDEEARTGEMVSSGQVRLVK